MKVRQSLDIVNIKIKMPIWQLNFEQRKKTGGNSRPGNKFFHHKCSRSSGPVSSPGCV